MLVFAPSAAVAPAAPPAAVPLTAADSYNHNHTASPLPHAYTTPSIQVNPAAQAQAAEMSAGLVGTVTAPPSAPPLPVFPETLVPVGPGGAPLVAASALPSPPQQPQHADTTAGLLTPPTLLQAQLQVSGVLRNLNHVGDGSMPATSAMLAMPRAQQPQQLQLTLPPSRFILPDQPLSKAVCATTEASQSPIDTRRLMVTTSWNGGSPGSSGLGLSASDAPSSIPPSSLSLSTFSPNHASMLLSVGGSPTGVLTLTSPPPQLVFDGPCQPTAFDVPRESALRAPPCIQVQDGAMVVDGCFTVPSPSSPIPQKCPLDDGRAAHRADHPGHQSSSVPIPAQAGDVRDSRDVVVHRAAPTVPPSSSSPAPQKCPLIAVGGVLQRPLAMPAQDVASPVNQKRRRRRGKDTAQSDSTPLPVPQYGYLGGSADTDEVAVPSLRTVLHLSEEELQGAW